MKYWTWSEIREKIEQECDLEDEDFVRREELLAYCNEAIDEAEAEIHTLYEDYFLKYQNVAVSANDEEFDLPADIYAHKIRRLIFKESGGTTTYTVNRIKDWKKFEEKAVADTQVTTDLYQYILVNATAGSPKITLVPKSRESGTLVIWYLRNANRLVNDSDICDIPEFINFIFSHMKVKVFGKEGHPGYQQALERLETERQRMTGVLQQMVPDADNDLEMDTSYYTDMN